MPTTQTAFNVCNGKIVLADSNGVDRDISGSSNNASFSRSIDTAEYFVFGDNSKYRLQCKKDGTLALTVVGSKGVNEGWYLIKQWDNTGGARHFRAYMPEDAIGNDALDGYFVMESYEVPWDAGEAGPVMITANLLPSGPVTIATVTT